MRSTSENADIFTTRDKIYLVLAEKKVNFLFILYSTEIQKAQTNFFLGRFSFEVTFAVCLLGITLVSLHLGCKRSLHLENGLECCFNERNVRKSLVVGRICEKNRAFYDKSMKLGTWPDY